MASVYTGYGIDRNRAARIHMRSVRRKNRIHTASLIKLLSLIILFTCAATYCIVGVARAVDAKNQLSQSLSYQNNVSNRINAVRFEIQRELLPENLGYRAQTRLGMINPPVSASLNLLASSDGAYR